MVTEVALRRGTTAQNDAFTGVEGEVTFNTQNHRLRTHDGITLGGFELALMSDLTAGLAAGAPPFTDTNALIKGSVDTTKLLRFEVDGFTAATTRVLTPQNSDYIIAGTNISNTFSVNQTFQGVLLSSNGSAAAPTYSFTSNPNVGWYNVSGTLNAAITGIAFIRIGEAQTTFGHNLALGATITSPDVILARDAANVLALRNGVNAQTFNVYGTFTDTSNLRRLRSTMTTAGAALIMAEGLGTGLTGNALTFGTDGTNRWTINSSGHLVAGADNTYDIGASGATRPRSLFLSGSATVAGNADISGFIQLGAANALIWNTRSRIKSSASGVIELLNGAENDFGRLNFGGTTSSFPALKRSTTGLQFRLADDSAYTFADALEYRASGTKVVGAQGAAVADAAGGANVDAEARTAINTLLARLRTHGLIAT